MLSKTITPTELIQFVLDKCKCRCAGNCNSPFAYLWQTDWDLFEQAAHDIGIDSMTVEDGTLGSNRPVYQRKEEKEDV